jgi:hypothetical protein
MLVRLDVKEIRLDIKDIGIRIEPPGTAARLISNQPLGQQP